ncbi:MAG: hypothetical protein ABI444_04125 [Candidatus Kapaibacterium sp.]
MDAKFPLIGKPKAKKTEKWDDVQQKTGTGVIPRTDDRSSMHLLSKVFYLFVPEKAPNSRAREQLIDSIIVAVPALEYC